MSHKRTASGKEKSLSHKLNLAKLFDRNECYPVYSRLCQIIPLQSLLKLSATSHYFRDRISSQWNVDKHLRRFVDNPKRFRSQLGAHNALVSGSLALQFFERVTWPDSDLDVFLNVKDMPSFSRYLITEERCTEPSTVPFSKDMGRYALAHIESVQTLYKQRPGSMKLNKIQLVAVGGTPLQTVLMGFYMTAIVNFITWNKAYSIFPRHTFLQHKGYLLQPLDEYLSMLLRKYAGRGWNIQGHLWEEEKNGLSSIQEFRRIGDHHSWIKTLDTRGVAPPDMLDTVLEYSEFKMVETIGTNNDYVVDTEDTEWYKVKASRFVSPVLRGQYTYDCDDGCLHQFGERLEKQAKLEMRKIEPSKRPSWYKTILDSPAPLYYAADLFSTFNLPDTWKYYDDEIPAWYRFQEGKNKGGLEYSRAL